MEPVKEGPSWAICQLRVRGDQSAAVHGDGQAFRKIHKTIWHRLVENIRGSHYSRIISLHWLMLRKRARV